MGITKNNRKGRSTTIKIMENNKEKNSRIRTIKLVIDIILVILIYNILLVGISCINKIEEISIFGYKAYVITTNSMEPNIKDGDILITKNEKEENLQVGDIITFQKKGTLVTHRITNIEDKQGKKEYTTKGDNNTVEDLEKVNFDEIKGKEILTIPKLGKLIKLLENQIVFLLIILIILILLFWKLQIQEKKEIRREKKRIEEEKQYKY